MKIACQGITFGGQRHKDDVEGILRAVSGAGYDGFETGFARLNPEFADVYKSLMKKYSLSFAAIHIGGDFQDEASVKNQMNNIPNLVKLALSVDCENIFISGSPPKDGANYKLVAKNLNILGAKLKESGLTLSYHNHDWEIKNEAHGLYAIYENTESKNLSFVPDVGWITRGKANPVDVLKKIADRISHVHFKEFTSDGKFTEMGRGVVDFKGVYEFLRSVKSIDDTWFVAEQDQSDIGAEESVRINCEYIRALEK